MKWESGPAHWKELERSLSGGQSPPKRHCPDGGGTPVRSRKREPYKAAPIKRIFSKVPYAELHCHSCFSFLDGVSTPETLVEEAVRLNLQALALTDHNGFHGVVRFAEAARRYGLPTVFGVELTVDMLDTSISQPDPDGTHLLVLARNPTGYAALSRVISEAQLAGAKGAPRVCLEEIDRWVKPGEFNDWMVLTGCRKGSVVRALTQQGPPEAVRRLHELVDFFGENNVSVELWDHGLPTDSQRNDALTAVAAKASVPTVATNNVHYATVDQRRLATAVAAVRARRSLEEMAGWLPAAPTAHLRSGDEQAGWFQRFPQVVERAAELGRSWGVGFANPRASRTPRHRR